jgi:hypothetical protein
MGGASDAGRLDAGAAKGRRKYFAVTALRLSFLLAAGAAQAGPAIGQFEVKDLEVELGTLQFQSQNAFALRQPRRRLVETSPGSFEYDDNSVTRQRHSLELEAHLTSFFRSRVGIEFEKDRLDSPELVEQADSYGSLKLASAAIEGVLVIVPTKGQGLGLGLMTEFDHSLSSKEADNWFIGPIFQYDHGSWRLTADLLAVRFFSPVEDGVRDNKWDFAYAAQLRYKYSETWSLAVEAYGTVDRVAGTGTPGEATLLFGDHDQHRIGPIVYYSYNLGGEKLFARKAGGTTGKAAKGVGGNDDKPASVGDDDDDQPKAVLGVGLLAGLTPATPDVTLKWSLEIEF